MVQHSSPDGGIDHDRALTAACPAASWWVSVMGWLFRCETGAYRGFVVITATW
jgi:hypothetical protein